MRLPTATARQQDVEDAREAHERLYSAWLQGEKVFFPVSIDQDTVAVMCRMESNLHQFWRRRGWCVRCKLGPNKSGFWLWVQPKREVQEQRERKKPRQEQAA